MAVGLRLPCGVDPTGGAALVSKDSNNEKIIKTALSNCYSNNAFQQDLGLGDEFVFDITDATLKARVQRKLVKLFKEFTIQKRFQLLTDTIKWSENVEDQELIMTFKYHDMEADEEKDITQVYSASGGA